MGILTIWREFRSKQSGEKRHQRGRITHGERLRAEQSQDWRRFREEQVEASGAGMGIWDLAGSSGSLSSHFPALSRYYQRGRRIFTVTVRKNIPDRGSWARFLRENLQFWNKHEELARGDLCRWMGIFFFSSWVLDSDGKLRVDCSCFEVLPPAIFICTSQKFIYHWGAGWETAGGSWDVDVSPRKDGQVPSCLKLLKRWWPFGHFAEEGWDSLVLLTGFCVRSCLWKLGRMSSSRRLIHELFCPSC